MKDTLIVPEAREHLASFGPDSVLLTDDDIAARWGVSVNDALGVLFAVPALMNGTHRMLNGGEPLYIWSLASVQRLEAAYPEIAEKRLGDLRRSLLDHYGVDVLAGV